MRVLRKEPGTSMHQPSPRVQLHEDLDRGRLTMISRELPHALFALPGWTSERLPTSRSAVPADRYAGWAGLSYEAVDEDRRLVFLARVHVGIGSLP